VSPRGFGRHWVDEHGHLSTPSMTPKSERHPSGFPPALIEENRATIARKRAELHRPERDAAE